jgi:hypothetical protein
VAIVRPLQEEALESSLREEVQFFKGPLGVVPNSVRTMAHRPEIARAFTRLNVAVMTDYGRSRRSSSGWSAMSRLSPQAACIARRT